MCGRVLFEFFFFSSRRRHTRWPRDWSSDVCSSDLTEEVPFTDAANGDYTLASNSPAIDAGDNTYYTDADKGNGDLENDLDLAGNPRVYDLTNGGIIDMGAYEYQGNPVPVIQPDADNIRSEERRVGRGRKEHGEARENSV